MGSSVTSVTGSVYDSTVGQVVGPNSVTGDVLKVVNDSIVKPVVSTVENTLKAASKDPLGTAAMIATSIYAPALLPLTNAAVTVAKGGSVKDAAKVAALTWVTTEGLNQVGMSDYTKGIGEDLGIQAQVLQGFTPAQSAVLSNTVTAGLNSAIVGGTRALLTGQDISKGITNGLLSGAAYGSTGAYFNELAKAGDIDLSPKYVDAIGKMAGAGLSALATGKDAPTAIGNYLSYTLMKAGGSELAKEAKDAYNTLTGKQTDVQKALDSVQQQQVEFNRQVDVYQSQVDDYNANINKYNESLKAWTPVQEQLDAQKQKYDDVVAEYNKYKAIYDDTSKSVTERNSAADQMAIYAATANDEAKKWEDILAANKDLSQSLIDEQNRLNTEKAKLDQSAADLKNPNSDVAKPLTEATNNLNKVQADYQTAADVAKAADEKFTQQVAESATKNITIDAINQGVIKPVSTDQNGNVTFDNGMVLSSDGKFTQGDKPLFDLTSGIEQNALKFTDANGYNYEFNNNSQRLSTDSDVQKYYKDNYGIDITPQEAKQYAGSTYGTFDDTAIKDDVINRIDKEFEKYGYKAPADQYVESLITPGGSAMDAVAKAVDPYYVSDDEAKKFVRDTLGREATADEVAMLKGAKSQAGTLNEQQAQQLQMYDFMKSAFGAAQKAGQGTQYAQADVGDGTTTDGGAFKIDVSGIPIYADIGNAPSDFKLPTGYRLATTKEADQKTLTGAAYDPDLNAWIIKDVPDESNTSIFDLLGFSSSGSSGTPVGLQDFPLIASGDGNGGAGGSGGNTGGAGGTTSGATTSGTKTPGTTTGGTTSGTGGTGTGGTTTTTTPGSTQQSVLTQLLSLGAMPAATQTTQQQTPLQPTFLSTGKGDVNQFESPLAKFLKEQEETDLTPQTPYDNFQFQDIQEQPMKTSFYDYGEQPTLDEIFNPQQAQQSQQTQQMPVFGMLNPAYQSNQQQFGMLSPLMVATGGSITGTRHGRYAHGGMATPLMAAGGKMRVDFRHGDAVTGPGDGQSDDIPAMLADGEFVFPADVVAAIGNGSTKAGSDKLYDMMHGIRAHVRSAKPKDLPPEINSPLDFLKHQPKKRARSK